MRKIAVICFTFFCVVAGACSANENVADNTPTLTAQSAENTPDDTNRPQIIAFGDSLTAGFGLSDPQKSYPSLLQASLEHEGFDYQVINLGFGGDTVKKGLDRLWIALQYANVKIFILELGANDIIKKTPAAEIRGDLDKIIKRVKGSGAKIILCGFVPPTDFGDEYAAEIREMYENLSKENELALLPDFMKEVRGNPERMLADGIHPNEKGAEVIEQNVRSVVQPLLVKNDNRRQKK